MNRLLFLLIFLLSSRAGSSQSYQFRMFDTARFFDGYKKDSIMNTNAAPGVVRLNTSTFAKKFTTAQLDSIGDSLTMQIVIKALCDNYDRIGSVSIAFTNKGDTTYNKTTNLNRFELARFITPFMNKNVKPDTVPYIFKIDNVARILRDKTIRSKYDIWCELSVFGVASAAQTQVSGCSGRWDVFFGFIDFKTNRNRATVDSTVLMPFGDQATFNNYKVGASDTIGVTRKTITITVPDSITEGRLILITSNHGSNTGGEEYIRRDHYVYFDDNLMLQYKPGDSSCEPYRKYNTQGNGIYGPSPQTNAQWQSFNNWCPGSRIPIREIYLGSVSKGNHIFKIDVPDAVFNGGQGNFPFSLYFQGKLAKRANAAIHQLDVKEDIIIYPNPANKIISIQSTHKIRTITIKNMLGQEVLISDNANAIDVAKISQGNYLVYVEFENKALVVKTISIQH